MLKWVIDRTVALLALILLTPVLGMIAIAICIKMGWPPWFTQPRPGKNGQIFTFYKFRTMTNQLDGNGQLLPDEQRLTPFGQFIRKTSLDELPQLWNVLLGHMSLVGPRPLIVEYLDRYTPEQNRRHEVLPGITGLAQINGRNAISWESKFEMDVWYIDHWSLWLDCKILALTVWKVLKRDGINQEGFATSEEFMGTLDP
ncbi:undecaprenyl-phosphate galactose phosphotransferase, putative [Acaryochloris marina MBIC11017]|uniref:Undecaprenyl-phosphate galactose phosphotransferase, putative n=1 Tax=Acaryochloris marina (strain MBIC 11017) TaxID=329726 RepID=B0CC28_ACAM1|nr:undecaprenyl-phosphate galactose phosphotransferase, putative [Acaryochloris marina MBIC11017]